MMARRGAAALLAVAVALAAAPAWAEAPPRRLPPPRAGAHSQGFDVAGFGGSGFNGDAAMRGFDHAGFNTPGFNSPGFNPRGAAPQACGRLLVPAASLATTSRGFQPGHAGIDFIAAEGTPVRAAGAGVVTAVGRDEGYGLYVDIRHPGGIATRYAHLSAFGPNIVTGAAVRMGTELGRVGATGNARGTHLHFEVRVAGVAVDPKPFLVGAQCPAPRGRAEPVLEARAPRR
jgi:murein DD-endopeptidase MepM/ murein hydrolase activator NlpD